MTLPFSVLVQLMLAATSAQGCPVSAVPGAGTCPAPAQLEDCLPRAGSGGNFFQIEGSLGPEPAGTDPLCPGGLAGERGEPDRTGLALAEDRAGDDFLRMLDGLGGVISVGDGNGDGDGGLSRLDPAAGTEPASAAVIPGAGEAAGRGQDGGTGPDRAKFGGWSYRRDAFSGPGAAGLALLPCSRHSSAAGAPPSIWRSTPMIWASVKRGFFIGTSSFILPSKFYFRISLRSGGGT